eukprot:PRCOL_00005185-RA
MRAPGPTLSTVVACPGCGSDIKLSKLPLHIAKCSPELLHEDVLLAADERLARSRGAGGPETTPSPARSRSRPRGLRSGDAAHAHAFAAVAAVRARQLEDAVCRLRYAEGRSEAATAAALGLPVARVPALVRRASRRLELRADVGTPPLDVLYEDDDLVAVAKPPGLRTTPVHRWQGGSLVNRLIGHLGAPPLPVHHAGAVARAAHAEGGEGWFEVDAPIGRLADQGAPVYGVVDEARGGKASFTRFETLAWALGGEGGGNDDTAGAAHTHHTLAAGALLLPDEGVWLGRARPRTGRTHQIRVHACAAGLPLLGDTLYAPESGARHALHAHSLELRHPRTDEPLVIRAPLPEDMARAALVAGLKCPAPWASRARSSRT